MRVDNWHSKLIQAFESAHGRRFRWGRHDCCQFAARIVQALTGDDRRSRFPRYSTRTEAEALLQRFGGMRGLLEHALGETVHRSRAGDGDIVLVDFGHGQGEQPAVCRGAYSYAPGRRNLVKIETLKASAAWVL